MIGIIALVVALVALVVIERKVKPWAFRVALNLLLILAVAASVGSVGVEIGKSLERNRFAIALPRIFEQLQETSEPLRSERILVLKKQMGSSKVLGDIENVADQFQPESAS